MGKRGGGPAIPPAHVSYERALSSQPTVARSTQEGGRRVAALALQPVAATVISTRGRARVAQFHPLLLESTLAG